MLNLHKNNDDADPSLKSGEHFNMQKERNYDMNFDLNKADESESDSDGSIDADDIESFNS